MKKVSFPKLKELFQYNEGLNDFMKFHEEVNIYNPFTFMTLSGAGLLLAGFFNRQAFVLGSTILCFMVVQFLFLKRMSRGVFIRRSAPKKAREKEILAFKYTLENRSPISQKNYLLFDSFTGSQKGSLILASPVNIKANSRTPYEHKFPADGGMGIHQLSGLKLSLQDPLGLFHVTIEETGEEEMEIFPALEPIPELKYRFNTLSYHFGEKDIPHRGDSINFYGTRQYRPGDPIKTINWRLSAKHNETIVNIFEKNINKSLTLLLNRDARLHSGLGSHSTMEYLKDFILAVASQNISNGNEVEVISNDERSPLGSGQEFINRLEFFLFNLNCIEDPKAAQLVSDTMKRFQDWESGERSLIYFTPIVPGPLFEKNMEQLVHLKNQGKEIEVVMVNAFSFIDQRLKFGGPLSVKHQLAIVLEREKIWKKIFREKDIPCYSLWLDPKKSFPEKVQKAKEGMWSP